MDAENTASIQSLSKVITAVCVNELFKSKKLKLKTTLGMIFGDWLKILKIDSKTNSKITLSQLNTHTSGLNMDTTQRKMDDWIGEGKSKHIHVARGALIRKLKKIGEYCYNNENYAILGTVIEYVSGENYTNFCKQSVLSPAGIKTAKIS